jgi:hypothetical protein
VSLHRPRRACCAPPPARCCEGSPRCG